MKRRREFAPELLVLMLAELRGRCRIDEDGHWIWTGAHSQGYPRVWAPDFTNHHGGMRSQQGRRAVWHLTTGKPIAQGWRVFGTCDERSCMNPGHIVCEPVAKRGAKVAASGVLKGQVRRIIANRATNRKRSRLTPELVSEILTSEKTGQQISRETGLGRTTISRVRQRKALSFVPGGGLFTGLVMTSGAQP